MLSCGTKPAAELTPLSAALTHLASTFGLYGEGSVASAVLIDHHLVCQRWEGALVTIEAFAKPAIDTNRHRVGVFQMEAVRINQRFGIGEIAP